MIRNLNFSSIGLNLGLEINSWALCFKFELFSRRKRKYLNEIIFIGLHDLLYILCNWISFFFILISSENAYPGF